MTAAVLPHGVAGRAVVLVFGAVALVIAVRRTRLLGPLRRPLRSLTEGVRFAIATLLQAASRWTMRRVAFGCAEGSRLLAIFRTESGIGRRINDRSRPVRRAAFRLVRPLRSRLFDRIVCGAPAVEAFLAERSAPPQPRVVYAERFASLGVTTVLGVDDAAEHHRLRAPVDAELAAARRDAHEVLEQIEGASRTCVSGAPGRVDAVADVIVPSCTRAMELFLGLDRTLADEVFQWAQIALHRVFLSPALPSGAQDWLAETSARSARARLEAMLLRPGNRPSLLGAGRRADMNGAANVDHDPALLGRLMGYALSLGPHLAWASAHVLDELLRHRDHLGVFAPSDDDDPGVTDRQRHLVLEALRVRPPTSFVVRVLATDLPLAKDGRPIRRVGAGVVAVFTGSADVDRARWTHPLRFDPSRFDSSRVDVADGPRPPHPYAFSTGLHLCPGIDLAPELILRVLRPLLRTAELRRAPGPAGRLSCQLARWQPMREAGRWPLPTSLTVTYRDEVPAFVPDRADARAPAG